MSRLFETFDLLLFHNHLNMNAIETHKAKEAERHTKLRLKKKNELVKLRCLRQFLCDNHKPILTEFERGYDEEKNEYVPPQQLTTSSSSQTEADNDIFDEIMTGDLSLLPQPEDTSYLFHTNNACSFNICLYVSVINLSLK